MWPSVFDDITRLLDTDKSGVNNWKQLAGKLNVPKTEHQNFEESDDPAMKLLEYFMATDRNPTVGRLRGELEVLGMTKASQIISNSEEGWSFSDYMIVIKKHTWNTLRKTTLTYATLCVKENQEDTIDLIVIHQICKFRPNRGSLILKHVHRSSVDETASNDKLSVRQRKC